MNLSYSKKNLEQFSFEYKIFANIKIHSIRLDPHKRWKVGMKIHHCKGLRTKNYKCFKIDECKNIQEIIITLVRSGYPIIHADNKSLGVKEMVELAKNDGFNNLDEFYEHFFGNAKSGVFEGRIIFFTDFKY